MAEVNIQNNVISSNYNKVIDTEFKTFTVPVPVSINQITIDQFFQYYNDLFYQIPKEGNTNSHTYIINRTAEYLGIILSTDNSIQALLDEISGLRQQILSDDQNLANIANVK
jgi:hypothetical protein